MKKLIVGIELMLCLLLLPPPKVNAQIPVLDIIKEAVKKVIIAIDLKIQRLQNKTIWLQQAQKTLENTMSKLRLGEIGEWVEKQRTLYADYFKELRKVKNVLIYYQRVKDITSQQVQLVNEYKAAWALFKQDKHFTTDELDYMLSVYTGMISESGKNIDQLFLAINAFVTQMSDASRLEIINTVATTVQQNLMDLREFNEQNKMVSLQRAHDQGDIESVKRLYGL